MSLYEELGVRRVINAKATMTPLGGSLMPREVLDAMVEAATAFVSIPDLQAKIGARIATLTHNEGAYVSSSVAAGLTLAAAACATGTDVAKVAQVPDLTGMRDEIATRPSNGRPAPLFASLAPSSARNPSAMDAVSESMISMCSPSTALAAISAAPNVPETLLEIRTATTSSPASRTGRKTSSKAPTEGCEVLGSCGEALSRAKNSSPERST